MAARVGACGARSGPIRGPQIMGHEGARDARRGRRAGLERAPWDAFARGRMEGRAVSADLKQSVNHLVDVCHGDAYAAGWWTGLAIGGRDLREMIRRPADPLEALLAGALIAQKLALIHSEVSEAMEGHRKDLPDDKLPHRPMVEVELADAVIRICDLAGAMGLDLGGAVEEKLACNRRRADHKPEARLAAGGKAY